MFDDLIEARDALLRRSRAVLDHLDRGELPPVAEDTHLDCKEEPGRRGPGGVLLPGEERNTQAAEYLAREVCCMANTPGGGALLLGVADGTWEPLGTALDAEWLRQRIYQRSDIAPTIDVHHCRGQRLLLILVAEAAEPVEDPDGKIRWRVGDSCQPVDRSEWWYRRQASRGLDPMAAETARTVTDVRVEAVAVAREFLRQSGHEDLAAAADPSTVLRRLGALTSTDRLTQAGALFFCAAGRPLLRLARLDVAGGEVRGRFEPEASTALLEQLAQAEVRLDAWNPVLSTTGGFAEHPLRALPPRTVREAVLNGLVHRDWMRTEATEIEWTDLDHRLEVRSPGGFTGMVTSRNILTGRHARHPALSDLSRALGLVDRPGIGVDRMYRELVVLGHRPPGIEQHPGPEVRATMVGGSPDEAVATFFNALRPRARREDVHVVLLVDHLLRRPFLSLEDATAALQGSTLDAEAALDAAEQTRALTDPLLAQYKDVWMLSAEAIELLEKHLPQARPATRRRLLPYRRPAPDGVRDVVLAWLSCHDRITSGDLSAMTGFTSAYASRVLAGLVDEVLLPGSATKGRNAHFVRHPELQRGARFNVEGDVTGGTS